MREIKEKRQEHEGPQKSNTNATNTTLCYD